MLFDASFRRTQLLASEKFRKLFPVVHHWLGRESPYALHANGDMSRYTRLHIILRTTDAVMNATAPRGLEEIGIRTKKDVIRMGAGSVAVAARAFLDKYGADKLTVSIVADRLSDDGRELYDELFQEVPFEFVPSAPGNANTFRSQIDLASKDDDKTLVAVYEDDYLTDPKAFTTAFSLFNGVPKLCGFTPHAHPDVLRSSLLTRIYKLQGHFYKLVRTTTCTFLAGADLIRRHRRDFIRYDGYENLSINRVWMKEICLAPCCWTLAEHLHCSDLSHVQMLVRIPV